ncbi:DUF1338 domain protein [Aspergillus uvarum CBS 121591]|uniref:2-oxoadipate dioxygenase/decarboxylase n=1 Tax=Aspergillus uvarum CBS 121591 TaxID=1448315 RepID=A0A319D8N9_9EURO|nr:DUF1338 domain protein [Aspergillus uvarum CBS 121591]PYH76332.1 DUF1338 domain protein [Aspergillus uvarum CBS 121591]
MTSTNPSVYADKDDLRTRFAAAMSTMYRAEVPLYGDLMDIVRDINVSVQKTTVEDPRIDGTTGVPASIERLTQERHGAIRLGTPFEIRMIKRIFAVLGMHPIGYYDLSVAGLPMHATCFRPLSLSSLNHNPFRVFTTLLRPELLTPEARELAMRLLGKRNIFSKTLVELLDRIDQQDGKLEESQSEIFIHEAMSTFRWQPTATATFDQYQALKAVHPILPDIACFQSAHINHLTPRTLDILAAQSAMKKAGIAAKAQIEGPPARECPILLRQTSFLALEEIVHFRREDQSANQPLSPNDLVEASHKARFGEIEQRGAAVTKKGRELYDKLLCKGKARAAGVTPEKADSIAIEVFKEYPDTWVELRHQNLIYCEFKVTLSNASPSVKFQGSSTLEKLISEGTVEAVPITYEDFLPFSAAGIFQSNLQCSSPSTLFPHSSHCSGDLKGLEEAMETNILDLDSWKLGLALKDLIPGGR